MDSIASFLEEGISFQDFINVGSCNFYGAPVAIVVTIDRAFSKSRLVDVGIAIGYMVLAAHDMGLGTCPIGLISAFEDETREALNIPEEKEVIVGVAVGYPDVGSKVNRASPSRAPLRETVRFY
jgi:nitroreductase